MTSFSVPLRSVEIAIRSVEDSSNNGTTLTPLASMQALGL